MTVLSKLDLLFDDGLLLENRLDKERLSIPSLNANCDCGGYYPAKEPEDNDTDQSAAPSGQAT